MSLGNVAANRAQEDSDKNVWKELEVIAAESNPLDLSLGCANFVAPQVIRKAMQDVVDGPDFRIHQYTRGFGHPQLCQAISELYAGLLGRSIDPANEIIVCNGGMEALFLSFMGFLNPGDEAVIIEPFFDSYVGQITVAEGRPRFVPLRLGRKNDDTEFWELDHEELRKAFNQKTKLMVLNSPHNPTGKVFGMEDLELIAELCRNYGVCCISDEVYEWITYEKKHIRIATLPGMWDRTITIGSAGKSFSVTGWKLGWMIGPSNLLAGCKAVQQHCIGSVGAPLQEALARAIETELKLMKQNSPSSHLLSLSDKCRLKRDKIVSALREGGFNPIVPEGSFYILVGIKQIVERFDIGGDESEPQDLRFVKWLSREKKLQGIPPSIFYSDAHKLLGEQFVRFCFFKDDETLSRAAELLKQLKE